MLVFFVWLIWLKEGRFYVDYLEKGITRFEVVKQSLVKPGFDENNIELVFNKKFKSYFDTKEDLKEKLWLLVGAYDFDTPENKSILDEYCETHQKFETPFFEELFSFRKRV